MAKAAADILKNLFSIALLFFLILYLPTLPWSASMIFGTVLRSAGDTRASMKAGILIKCINVVLNFLLIYDTKMVSLLGLRFTVPGAGWGVIGAAAASAISFADGGAVYKLRSSESLPSIFRPDVL